MQFMVSVCLQLLAHPGECKHSFFAQQTTAVVSPGGSRWGEAFRHPHYGIPGSLAAGSSASGG
jgi:hypothetical protein